MESRCIKTNIWDSEEFNRLTNEAKVLYLCLLTCEKIRLTNVFEVPDRVLRFYTGFTQDQLQTTKDQLYVNGFVDFYMDWACLLTEIGYIASHYKGKSNEIAKNRQIEGMPEAVRDHFGVTISEYGLGETETYSKDASGRRHRIIAEQMLGRKLTSEEIVHHKDGNKRNNSMENLCVMLISDHNDVHNGKKRLEEVAYIVHLDTLSFDLDTPSQKNDSTINLNLNLNKRDVPVENFTEEEHKSLIEQIRNKIRPERPSEESEKV